MSRPAPPTTQSAPGGGKSASKFKRRLSAEQRGNLSEVAKERHRQSDGHGFGRGQQKPGTQKPLKKSSEARAAALVAEAARDQKNAQAIIEVFKDGVANSQPMHIRLKAAQAWIDVEQKDAALRLKENESDQLQRGREELLELLAGKFTGGPTAALLRKQLAQRVDLQEDLDNDIDPDIIEGKLSE